MAEAFAQIEQVAAAAAEDLKGVATAAGLEAFRVKYLGAKGQIKGLMRLMGSIPKDEKPAFGQRANAVQSDVQAAFDAKQAEVGGGVKAGRDPLDVTEPGARPVAGTRHILMRTVDELTDLFGRMGFSVAAGPEVEDEFHNFVALNIPKQHPARDPLDNFYLDGKAGENPSLLRTQTSTVQIRVMETQKPPIRVVIPGKVYRPDTVDQTHLFQFHQLEALVVDRDVTMVDLKSTILQFVKAYFGPDTKVRFRPSFFPFTEPSAEVDVWFEDKRRWIELGGCGMVHPNVFKAVNIDAEEYSGWAFGFGIERIAMRKYGVDDIRMLVENDVRFLRQF